MEPGEAATHRHATISPVGHDEHRMTLGRFPVQVRRAIESLFGESPDFVRDRDEVEQARLRFPTTSARIGAEGLPGRERPGEGVRRGERSRGRPGVARPGQPFGDFPAVLRGMPARIHHTAPRGSDHRRGRSSGDPELRRSVDSAHRRGARRGTGERRSELARSHPLRAADAIHLASALSLAPEGPGTLSFACWDGRLWKAASALGLSVVPATRPG